MIKIIKREDVDKKFTTIIRISAVLFSLIFAGMFIAFIGYNPVKVFTQMFFGAVGTHMRLQETINKVTPLVITSLGMLVAFKMKFWNIGGEGQITMGALGASFIALNYGDKIHKLPLIISMIVASVVFGGIWALIPAIFKVKFGTNETIFTLMLNYIAIKIVQYLQFGPWKDPAATGFPKIPTFNQNAVLPQIFGVHIGIIMAMVLLIFIYVFIKYTKKGYEIQVVGESMNTAKYAGMNVNFIILFAITLSGGLCGLAGMVQASAMEKTLSYTLSAGYGYTAIITTWLSNLKPNYILLTSIAFAILLQGGTFVQVSMQIPSAVSGMIQGIILFFVLGSEFFIKYKLVRESK